MINDDNELDIFIKAIREVVSREQKSVVNVLLTGDAINNYSDYSYYLGQNKVFARFDTIIRTTYQDMKNEINNIGENE